MDANRIEVYKDNLIKLLQRKEGYFIIFEETKTKKFVQFQTSPKAKQLLLDIPTREQTLSGEQIEKLNSLLVFECDSVELFSGEDPFQVSFINKTEYAAEIIERIFLEVFNLPNEYTLTITLDSFVG
jgi:hypothetical protein